MSEPRTPWQWVVDDILTNLETLRRQLRLLQAAVEALADRVKALEAERSER